MDAEALLTIPESIDLYFNPRKFFVTVISTTNAPYKSSDIYVLLSDAAHMITLLVRGRAKCLRLW